MRYKLILLLTFSYLGFSQGRIQHFTISEGLPHDITYGLFQDSKGYLWIGTDNGLAKFDGQKFKTFTTDDGLRTNYVIDITEDDQGTIALATWGGGLLLIENDLVVIPEVYNDSIDKINYISYHNNKFISSHVSMNWIYRSLPNYHFKKEQLVSDLNRMKMVNVDHVRPSDGYISVLDSILILSNSSHAKPSLKPFKGVYEIKSDKELRSIFPFLKDKNINSISALSKQMYIASQRDSVYLFDKNNIIKRQKIAIDNPFITKINETKSGDYLILTSDVNGLKNALLFNSDFKELINFKNALELNSTISDALEDHEGNIWISSFGDGLFCYEITTNTKADTDFNNGNLPELFVLGNVKLHERNYILTPNYLTEIKNDSVNPIKLKNFGKHVSLHNDTIYLSSLGYENFNKHTDIKQNNAFRTFYVERYGEVIYSDSLLIKDSKVKIPAEKKTIYDAITFNDSLWFATNSGTFYFNEQKKSLEKANISGKKLLGDQVVKFLKDKNTIWIATTKGLSKIADHTIEHFTKEDGLVDNQINTMILDHRNHLWIGTHKGISVCNGKDFLNITEARILKSPYVASIFEDEDHIIWIGGNKGISIINNAKERELQNPPILNITQSGLAFQYSTISFNRSHELVCEYKLDVSDKWLQLPNASGEINFTNNKIGDYNIQFRAKKNDGTWARSKTYAFKVKELWYKNGFIISGIIALLSFLIIVNIVKQLKKAKLKSKTLKIALEKQIVLEKELTTVRSNIAQDFHDDLGNKLARISLLSSLVEKDMTIVNKGTKNKIKQITEDANDLYDGTRDFIFSLKKNSENLEEVVTYLSDFGEDFFSKTPIKFIVFKDIDSDETLPYYWSKQLIYIFKEALTNTLKHSQCDTVKLKFLYRDKRLHITCEDNGIGLCEADLSSSNGIKNMKERALKIGGELIINSENNNGTVINFVGDIN